MIPGDIIIPIQNEAPEPLVGPTPQIVNFAAASNKLLKDRILRNVQKLDPEKVRAAGKAMYHMRQAKEASEKLASSSQPAPVQPTAPEVEKEAKPVSSDVERELVDTKIALSESRTDVKFAQLNGRFDQLVTIIQKSDEAQTTRALAFENQVSVLRSEMKAEALATRSITVSVGLSVGFGLAALFLGIVFGLPSVYSLGTSTQSLVQSEVQKALPKTTTESPVSAETSTPPAAATAPVTTETAPAAATSAAPATGQ